MENIRHIEVETYEGIQHHVIIDHSDGSFTSMPKAVWDEQQAQKELGGTL